MADLGAIAEALDGGEVQTFASPLNLRTLTGEQFGEVQTIAPPLFLRKFIIESEDYVLGAKETTLGNPSQPSLRMKNRGKFRFRWAFTTAGPHTVSVRVLQAVNLSPRPSLVVRPNTDVGISADLTATASSSTDWVTIGPLTINPTVPGAVWVELHANYDGQLVPCYWDHVVVT